MLLKLSLLCEGRERQGNRKTKKPSFFHTKGSRSISTIRFGCKKAFKVFAATCFRRGKCGAIKTNLMQAWNFSPLFQVQCTFTYTGETEKEKRERREEKRRSFNLLLTLTCKQFKWIVLCFFQMFLTRSFSLLCVLACRYHEETVESQTQWTVAGLQFSDFLSLDCVSLKCCIFASRARRVICLLEYV